MAIEIDYTKLTTREIRDLCESSETPNLSAYLAAVNEMAPKALAALVWVMKRKESPDLTLDEAYDIPIDELGALFGKNAGSAAGSTTTSSVPSAPSTTSRRTSSGKPK